MDKVAILTASRKEPTVSIAPHTHSSIYSLLSPTLPYAGYLQSVLGATSAYLCWQAYIGTKVTLAVALYASRIVAMQAVLATKFGAFYGCVGSWRAVLQAWDSKTMRTMRDKVFYEFAVFILGFGNPLILLLFWPGWLVLAGTTFAFWQYWI